MPIILRSEKGAPLTIDELDGNFKELTLRLEDLEGGDFKGETISEVTLEGSELVIKSNLGREVARYQFPVPQFVMRGPWAPQTSYAQSDFVCHEGCVYMAPAHHTSQQHFEPQEWKLFLDGRDIQNEKLEASSSKEVASSALLTTLPLYEKETLPEPELGKIALLIHPNQGMSLVIGDGEKWQGYSSSL